MVGGGDYARSTFNRATRSKRQPGSAFKPIRLRRGARARLFAGVGAVGPAAASRRPAIRNGRRRNARHGGTARRADAARGARSNRTTRPPRICSSAIGSRRRARARVGRRARGSARRAVARARHRAGDAARTDGRVHDVSGRRRARRRRAGCVGVTDAEGREVFTRDGPDQRACREPRRSRFRWSSMLRDVVDRGTGAPARTLGVRGPVGGKTGTTDDYHDAWFVGFSTSVVVAASGSASISRRRSAATRTPRASRCRSGRTS